MGTLSDVVVSHPLTAAPYDQHKLPPGQAQQANAPSKQPAPLSPTLQQDGRKNGQAKIDNKKVKGSVPPEALEGSEGEEEGVAEGFGPRFRVMPANRQLKELQTIIRDKNTSRSDFKFYADRLIRLVVEEGLNQLPYSACEVRTPTNYTYTGLKFTKGNCGVSIVRSGEAMEQGLRSCCRSIRLGKILVESDVDTHEARVVYAKFPDDVSRRKVLLMYPIMSSGNTVRKAVRVLKDHYVNEANIILLNLFSTPMAARALIAAFPNMTILTSEVNSVAPNHFGQKYFGTD